MRPRLWSGFFEVILKNKPLSQDKSIIAMQAMDAVVSLRIIQHFTGYPNVIFLAFRTDDLQHSRSSLRTNLSMTVGPVKEIPGYINGVSQRVAIQSLPFGEKKILSHRTLFGEVLRGGEELPMKEVGWHCERG